MKPLRKVMPALASLSADHMNASSSDEPNEAHFHHLHLNVTDPAASIAFYKKYLGGKVDALFTERSFILLNKVGEPARSAPTTSLKHVGWSGVDGPAEYEWLKRQGVEFETPPQPLGEDHYMYFYGEDRELLEIYTGARNHRFEHMHFWAEDPNVTAKWFVETVGDGIQADGVGEGGRPRPEPEFADWVRSCTMDNVNFCIFGLPRRGGPAWPKGMPDECEPTKGSVIDHLAFSYRNIEPVFERMKAAGVEIVEPTTRKEEGHDSFFIMGPGKLLFEIVEDRPIPEGIWE